MRTKAVIFDLDGTLYDNSKLPLLVVLNDLQHIRLLYAERKCRRAMAGLYFGKGDACCRELFKRVSEMTGKSVEEISDWYKTVFLPLQAGMLKKHFHTKPWVRPVFEHLKSEGVKTACFSDYEYVEEKLEALGLSPDLFDCISDAPSEGGCKPCAESFLNMAARLGEAPSEILVVGDRDDNDGAGAYNAGMMFYKVTKRNKETVHICE